MILTLEKFEFYFYFLAAAVPDEENSDEAQGFLYHFEDFLKINDTLETIKLMMQGKVIIL